MSSSHLGLPPIPPELKGMSPYLQRAEELKTRDPIMSYWCAYYAAQVGIGLKVKEPSARNVLFDLLGRLERMKREIGPNDAIDEESVSSAFVENFALKVFSSADNEDRRGEATRATAKKFLAAANFLEILSIFEFTASEFSSFNTEKIRYSKWKAADIAKAYREGRKPTPGPAGEVEIDSNPLVSTVIDSEGNLPNAEETTLASPSLYHESTSGPIIHPPAIIRSAPPPPQLGNLPTSPFTETSAVPPISSSHLIPDAFVDPRTAVTPGAWSTAATPGSPVEPPSTTPFSAEYSDYEPSIISVGLDCPTASQESIALHSAPNSYPEHGSEVLSNAPLLSPPPLTPRTTQPLTSYPISTTSSQTPQAYGQVPKRGIPSGPPPGAATITQAPSVELTPQAIAKIQKHCKFAISALDYEDISQARKELKEALRMLGG